MSAVPPDLWQALAGLQLYLDGTSQPLALDRAEIERYYQPLAERILKQILPQERRIVVVSGPPGSGKTAFAMTLTTVINTLADQDLAAWVGQDGWHYRNTYLDSHWVERAGQRVNLRAIKGAPETYDFDTILQFLQRVKTQSEIVFPIYSRQAHDPAEGAGRIQPHQRLVILEGNYWLLAEPPWNSLQQYFDLRIRLEVETGALAAGLKERHMRGGRPAEAADEHIRRVDLPNIERVRQHALPADILIHKAGSRRITGIEYPPSGEEIHW